AGGPVAGADILRGSGGKSPWGWPRLSCAPPAERFPDAFSPILAALAGRRTAAPAGPARAGRARLPRPDHRTGPGAHGPPAAVADRPGPRPLPRRGGRGGGRPRDPGGGPGPAGN